jgi:hypothetical protein
MTNASQLPNLAFKNRRLVEQSCKAGCFKCCKVFAMQDVQSHTDNGQTCLCPGCGHDCVVAECSGFDISEESLRKASKVIFG